MKMGLVWGVALGFGAMYFLNASGVSNPLDSVAGAITGNS